MFIDRYFNIGDIVKDASGEEWEVLDYAKDFDSITSMKETEFVSCKHLQTGKRRRIHQNELSFVKTNHKPFIFD